MRMNKRGRCAFHRQKVAGYNLMEIAFVFSTAGLVLGAIWAAASAVFFNNNVHTVVRQIMAISHNVRGIYMEQGSIAGANTNNNNINLSQALDQMKVFPLEMRQNQSIPAGIIFHPWSQAVSHDTNLTIEYGTVQVFADDCNGDNTQTTPQPCFDVILENLPNNACVALLEQLGQSGAGLQTIYVDTINMTLPVTPEEIKDKVVCGNGNANIIQWIFLLKG
jgi:PilS N terminal